MKSTKIVSPRATDSGTSGVRRRKKRSTGQERHLQALHRTEQSKLAFDLALYSSFYCSCHTRVVGLDEIEAPWRFGV